MPFRRTRRAWRELLAWSKERAHSLLFVLGTISLLFAVTSYLVGLETLAVTDAFVALALLSLHYRFSLDFGGGGLLERPVFRRLLLRRFEEGVILSALVTTLFVLSLALPYTATGVVVSLHVWLVLTAYSLLKEGWDTNQQEKVLASKVPQDILQVVEAGELTLTELVLIASSPDWLRQDAVRTHDECLRTGLNPKRGYWKGFVGRRRLLLLLEELARRDREHGMSADDIYLHADDFAERWKLRKAFSGADLSLDYVLLDALGLNFHDAERLNLERLKRKLAERTPSLWS